MGNDPNDLVTALEAVGISLKMNSVRELSLNIFKAVKSDGGIIVFYDSTKLEIPTPTAVVDLCHRDFDDVGYFQSPSSTSSHKEFSEKEIINIAKHFLKRKRQVINW